MRTVALVFLVSYACVGSEISGIWSVKPGGSKEVAIQIEQTGGQLRILKVTANCDGHSLQRFLLSTATIHSTHKGTVIRLPGEVWTIRADRELTVKRGRHRIVLRPAKESIEYIPEVSNDYDSTC